MDALWPMTADTWPLIRDSDGRVLDEYSLRKMTFIKGISPEIRPEVWLFLLGYYPFSSTWEERKGIDANKRSKYEELLSTWKSPMFVPDENFLKYERVIEKDCLRTDRHLDFYSEDSTNVDKLRRILNSFVIYDPEFGYVQGMNDILSPLLYVLESEHKAFWCFTDVVKQMHSTFSDLTLSQPLAAIARLCCYVSPQLHDHISAVYDGEDWIFCYRWILINFKREFSMLEILSLWERIWCNHATAHFQLFFTTAVLLHFRQELLQCNTVEDFMELTMKLSGHIPFHPLLSMAQALLEQLKRDEYCPFELTYLLSSSDCAPPPRVGFVRARQSFITLHSDKISLQRNQIWKSLFGDAPVQPITSPFMLSPVATMNQSDYKKMTSPDGNQAVTGVQTGGEQQPFQISGKNLAHELDSAADTTGECKPPPTFGFLPRERSIKFRDDIRNTQHRDSGPAIIDQPCDMQQMVRSDANRIQEQFIINARITLRRTEQNIFSISYTALPNDTTCSRNSTASVKSHQTWPLSLSENISTYHCHRASELEVDYHDSNLHSCELNFDSLRAEAELIPIV